MKHKKKPVTPQEFYALPIPRKQHMLALTYMATCTLKGFTKKSLFPLLRYFANKVDPVHYQCFFDYMYSKPEPTEVSLYDLYSLSQAWQGQLRLGRGKPVDVEEYPSLLQCLNEL